MRALAVGFLLLALGAEARVVDRRTREDRRNRLGGSSGAPLFQWLASASSTLYGAGVVPPANSGTTPTFSRASEGSCRNASGLIVNLAANLPCVEANGMRFGASVTNYFSNSNQLDFPVWGKYQVGITADQIASPSGLVDADALIPVASTTPHTLGQTVTNTLGASWTLSVYAKKGSQDWFALESSANDSSFFNLATGAIGTVNAAHTARIEPAANGFYRVSISFLGVDGGNLFAYFGAAGTNGDRSYTGDGVTPAAYVWGGQLEGSLNVSRLVYTSGSAATSVAESASIPNPNLSLTSGAAKACYAPGFSGNVPTPSDGYFFSANTGLTARLGYVVVGASQVRGYAGGSIVNVSSTFTRDAPQCYRVSWSQTANTLKVENLSQGTSSSGTFSGFPSFASSVVIGNTSSGLAPARGYLSTMCLSDSFTGCR